MPRPLKWGKVGTYTKILSKDIHNIAGKNLSIDSSVFVNFVQFPVTCKKSETSNDQWNLSFVKDFNVVGKKNDQKVS